MEKKALTWFFLRIQCTLCLVINVSWSNHIYLDKYLIKFHQFEYHKFNQNYHFLNNNFNNLNQYHKINNLITVQRDFNTINEYVNIEKTLLQHPTPHPDPMHELLTPIPTTTFPNKNIIRFQENLIKDNYLIKAQHYYIDELVKDYNLDKRMEISTRLFNEWNDFGVGKYTDRILKIASSDLPLGIFIDAITNSFTQTIKSIEYMSKTIQILNPTPISQSNYFKNNWGVHGQDILIDNNRIKEWNHIIVSDAGKYNKYLEGNPTKRSTLNIGNQQNLITKYYSNTVKDMTGNLLEFHVINNQSYASYLQRFATHHWPTGINEFDAFSSQTSLHGSRAFYQYEVIGGIEKITPIEINQVSAEFKNSTNLISSFEDIASVNSQLQNFNSSYSLKNYNPIEPSLINSQIINIIPQNYDYNLNLYYNQINQTFSPMRYQWTTFSNQYYYLPNPIYPY